MSVKITSKGQVTLPKTVRDYLNVSPGDEVIFRVTSDGSIIVEPKVSLMSLRGFVKTDIKGVSVEDMKMAIIEEGSS
ncbi:MAG: AbrB/MazE/SpoVT family DNA-binding domain-containing protein [Calditrichaeota bacterium]|nr:AbrB/MazE/SpoVT family DNA-binding domain-containing protein [Calditrichota bacterium]